MGIDSLKNLITNKKVVIISVIAIMSIILISLFKFSTTKLEKEAVKYFYEGNYDKAMEQYEKLSESKIKNALWDAKIAELYYLKRDYESCEKYLQSSKNKEDKNDEAINTILFVSLMNSNYSNVREKSQDKLSEVVNIGEEYLKKYPKNKEIIKTMITVYLSNNNFEKAFELADEYPSDKNSARDLAVHSSIYIALGEYDKGLEKLKEAFLKDKNELKIYDVVAQSYQYEKEVFLDKILELSDNNKDEIMYKVFLAKIYSLEKENAGKALQIIGELEKEYNVIQLSLIKVIALENSGDLEQSEALLQQILAKNKNDFAVNHVAGWFFYKKGDYAKAEEYAKKSIDMENNYVDNYGFLVPEILKVTEEGKGAEPYLYKSLKLEPFNNNLYANTGYYYWYTLKDSLRAIESLNLAKNFKKNQWEINYDIALIYLANNNYEEGINLLKKSVENSEATVKYHRTISTANLLIGNSSEGYKELQIAYSLNNKDILTINNLACYYLTVEGDLDNAVLNITEAYNGLDTIYDEQSKTTLKENYEKILRLKESYNNGADNEIISIPELTMFY
jgi:tetratricopeptide (TPR) repeat protein